MQMVVFSSSLFLLIFLWSTEQPMDHNTDIRLLQQKLHRNASCAERYHLHYCLVDFYLSNIFKEYCTKAEELGISKQLSTLANRFMVVLQNLHHCKVQKRLSAVECSKGKFCIFKQEFEKLNPEVGLTKAVGELDILFGWMKTDFRPH
ncbi:interleukin-24-like [Macrotis lagotis]|uniref:interleukin-24-like n=1 Tax=Macrotis lagotis TaxID=92651 RepID=UPI003D6918C2